jgi:uncharacterized protein (DUF58 family)
MVASSFGLALCGLAFGVGELYPLAATAAVLAAGAWCWVSGCRWDVRVQRLLRPARVPAGVEARAELVFRNHSPHRSPVLLARDPYEATGRAAQFLVAPLAPGERRAATFRLPTSRRGRFRLGPMVLELRDPFGLASATRQCAPVASLSVHPRVEQLRADALPGDARGEAVVPVPARASTGDEFYGLRHYEEGDDLRRIHWRSTARFDELMVREPETLSKGRLTLVVDLRSAQLTHAVLEEQLSAAASVMNVALHSDVEVRLLTTAGVDTGFCSRRSRGAPILDALAAATAHPGGSLLAGLVPAAKLGPAILFTAAPHSEDEMISYARRAGGGRATIVLFGHHSQAPVSATGRKLGGARFVAVPEATPFKAAWDRLPRC